MQGCRQSLARLTSLASGARAVDTGTERPAARGRRYLRATQPPGPGYAHCTARSNARAAIRVMVGAGRGASVGNPARSRHRYLLSSRAWVLSPLAIFFSGSLLPSPLSFPSASRQCLPLQCRPSPAPCLAVVPASFTSGPPTPPTPPLSRVPLPSLLPSPPGIMSSIPALGQEIPRPANQTPPTQLFPPTPI